MHSYIHTQPFSFRQTSSIDGVYNTHNALGSFMYLNPYTHRVEIVRGTSVLMKRELFNLPSYLGIYIYYLIAPNQSTLSTLTEPIT